MSTNSKLSNAAAAACAGDGTNKGLLPLLAAGVMTLYVRRRTDQSRHGRAAP